MCTSKHAISALTEVRGWPGETDIDVIDKWTTEILPNHPALIPDVGGG